MTAEHSSDFPNLLPSSVVSLTPNLGARRSPLVGCPSYFHRGGIFIRSEMIKSIQHSLRSDTSKNYCHMSIFEYSPALNSVRQILLLCTVEGTMCTATNYKVQ